MKNWHARQLRATSNKVCNMQAITQSYACQDDCILVIVLTSYIVSAFAKSWPQSQPNTLHKGWWLWRTKVVAWNTWATRAFNTKLTFCPVSEIFVNNIFVMSVITKITKIFYYENLKLYGIFSQLYMLLLLIPLFFLWATWVWIYDTCSFRDRFQFVVCAAVLSNPSLWS